MWLNAKEKMLSVGSKTFRCITFGSGKKPLVMIQGLNTNGIGGSAFPLAYMYRAFGKHYRVYLFDRRENITGPITVEELAADTVEIMDHLAITDADILGVSQGGMIAQYLAIKRPDLVRRLALAVTLGEPNPTVTEAINCWVSLAEQGKIRLLAEDMAQRMYSEGYIRRYRPFMPLLAVLQKPRNTERFVTLARSCLTCSTYSSLSSIRCPVLVIGGGQDKVVGSKAADELAEALGCPKHIYPSLGHALYEEAADFNGKVLDFFLS